MNGLSSTHSRMTLPWNRPFSAASTRPENTANTISTETILNSYSRSDHADTLGNQHNFPVHYNPPTNAFGYQGLLTHI